MISFFLAEDMQDIAYSWSIVLDIDPFVEEARVEDNAGADRMAV